MKRSVYQSPPSSKRYQQKIEKIVRLPFDKNQQQNQEAQKETTQQEISHEVSNQVRLNKLVSASEQPLMVLSAVFPFDFFPDQISIEPTQINVIKKTFFYTFHVQSIPIKNVADVFLQTSYFFAALRIIDSSYIENSIEVEYLKKAEACRARNIIQGLVVAMKEGIDLSHVEPSELARKVEMLGAAGGVDLAELEG